MRPARARIFGRTLVPPAGTCNTTKREPARVAGRPLTRRLRASTPPAEAPTTTTSRPGRLTIWLSLSQQATRILASRGGTYPRATGAHDAGVGEVGKGLATELPGT